jgi:hypothetical protein
MLHKYIIIFSMLILFACNSNDNAYTLYKIDPESQTKRSVVEIFKAGKSDEENLNACHKFRTDLLSKEETEDKYWCEKGGA